MENASKIACFQTFVPKISKKLRQFSRIFFKMFYLRVFLPLLWGPSRPTRTDVQNESSHSVGRGIVCVLKVPEIFCQIHNIFTFYKNLFLATKILGSNKVQ